MKLPEDIHRLLVRHFHNKRQAWLLHPSSNELNNDLWPVEIKLNIPTEEQALKQIQGVRAWLIAWQKWQGPGKLLWCDRQWKTLGIQRLPYKILLQSPEDITAWIGETTRWRQASTRFQTLIHHWPCIATSLSQYFNELADYREIDFQRLLKLLTWFSKNLNSALYPRQLPIGGIDSKWLEERRAIITKLVAAIQNNFSGNLNFFQCCGLKPLPSLIRVKILDKTLRNLVGGMSDFSAPIEDLVKLNLPVKNVFIIENLQSGLAISDLPGSIVILRLGYNVEILRHLSWIADVKCIYWGDIDTHGFAILHRARTYLPRLQSLMMDEETLLYHQDMWGTEEKQHTAQELSLLTKTEQNIYHSLKQHRWGQNIRLEQERIAWDFAWNKLQLSI